MPTKGREILPQLGLACHRESSEGLQPIAFTGDAMNARFQISDAASYQHGGPKQTLRIH
jgi:hypothetical protein